MSAAPIRLGQTREIHMIRRRTKLDDGSYRAMLQAYDVSSSKYLTEEQAGRLLRRMRDIPGASTPVEGSAKGGTKSKATGRFAPKLQAMWLALYNLGAIRDRRDSAMHAFLEGQTGIPHTRFLHVEVDATRVIQPLKVWMIREGVVWPAANSDRATHLLALKRAILRAQWLRCVALGAVTSFGRPEVGTIEDPSLTPAELDEMSRALGKKLRAAQDRAAKAKPVEVRHAG